MIHPTCRFTCPCVVFCWMLLSSPVQVELPEPLDLNRIGDRQFVLDAANVIEDADEQRIRQVADKLLTDKAVPIVVVTIDAMAQYSWAEESIEGFARQLFDQWGIGHAKLGDKAWNYGILLLVSRYDRKARIELGGGWKHEKDADAQRIMDTLMIPEFRRGDYSSGILAGVEGLDKMARGLQLPTRPRPASHYLIAAVLAGLAVFTIVSLIRRGSGGWAWLMWTFVFGVTGAILYHVATSSSSGGGFSGGSFGGGSSGGGGASGSW
jgi:uncharacterized protein